MGSEEVKKKRIKRSSSLGDSFLKITQNQEKEDEINEKPNRNTR